MLTPRKEPQGAFGTLRLALALLVVLYHFGCKICGIEQGVSAVVVFFVLSGYAMTGLWHRNFGRKKNGAGNGLGNAAGRFYLDRCLRLAPQYYLWLFACLLAVLCFPIDFGPYMPDPPGPLAVFAHLFVIPLNLLQAAPRYNRWVVDPPAWSLGQELCFYAVFPLVASYRPAVWAGAGLSLAVSMGAALHLYDQDVWGYRLLCGTLCYYLLGHAIYLRDAKLGGAIAIGLACCAAAAWATGHWHEQWTPSLPWGWGLGGLAVAALSFVRPRRWDTQLGHASYGAYLGHWIPVSAFRAHLGDWRYGLACVVIATAMGYTGYVVAERPTVAFRRRIRARRVNAAPG